MTLALLTPCHDGMYHTNYMDLIMYAAGKPGFKLMKSEYESDIVRHRSKMASKFLTEPAFADCWGYITVDADIGVRDLVMLDRLASIPKDVHIVAGVYVNKNGNQEPLCRGLTENRHLRDPNIVECECVPTGFTRVSRECLQAVYDSKADPDSADWWRLVYHARPMVSKSTNGKKRYESEDYAFCLDAGALGYKCWLDRCIRLTHRGFTLYKA